MHHSHQPYSQKEHWNAFWRMFYRLKEQGTLIEIPITEDMLKKAELFTRNVIKRKMQEQVHKRDHRNEHRRWMTGTLGELSLESFLGIRFWDSSIGHSFKYAVPDLSSIGLPIGVKSFRVGNFPLVNRLHTSHSRPDPTIGQIFLAIEINRRKAYLYGFADRNLLLINEKDPESNRYVKDFHALNRKTAFIKLDQLQSFQSLEELHSIVKQYSSKMTG